MPVGDEALTVVGALGGVRPVDERLTLVVSSGGVSEELESINDDTCLEPEPDGSEEWDGDGVGVVPFGRRKSGSPGVVVVTTNLSNDSASP